MERFAIIGLVTAVSVPLIYALKKRMQSPQLVQEEQEQEQDVEYMEIPESEVADVERLITILCAALVMQTLYSREIFYNMMIMVLERMQCSQ